VILLIAAIYIYPSVLLLAMSWLYALSGPAMWVWQKLFRRRVPEQGAP
jgi:hypothetical protein